MKKTLVGATIAVLAGAAGAGHAADLYATPSLKDAAPFVPAPVWTGFYLGANVGSAWSSIELGRNVF
ncbi:MAG: porin family protein, partial [Rhodomicrobium sp.]